MAVPSSHTGNLLRECNTQICRNWDGHRHSPDHSDDVVRPGEQTRIVDRNWNLFAGILQRKGVTDEEREQNNEKQPAIHGETDHWDIPPSMREGFVESEQCEE